LFTLQSEEDLKDPKMAQLLQNNKNTFFFLTTNTTLYFDEDDHEWYTRKFDEGNSTIELQRVKELIPVSSCMYTSNYGSATIQKEYSAQISLADSGTASIGFLNLTFYHDFGLAATIETLSSFTFTDTLSCTVGQGTYAQMFIEPLYVEVPDYTRMRVKFRRGKGIVVSGSPERRPGFSTLVAVQPNHVCKYSRSPFDLKCAGVK
ncbi:uncharacterized protein CANTADRAFT_28865, partial [Suhomyces tanzawaensis NRRL Y-17324]